MNGSRYYYRQGHNKQNDNQKFDSLFILILENKNIVEPQVDEVVFEI